MTRAEKKRRYRAFLQDILNRSDVLDYRAIVGIRELIEDMQERILGRIGGTLSSGNAFRTDGEGRLTDWGLFWIPRLIRSVDDIVKKISQEAGATLASMLAESWTLGAELVDGTLQAIEPDVSLSSPRLDKIALTTLAPFSAQLITKIDEETRHQVDRAIRRNVALGESPSVLMKTLQTKLDGKPSPFKSVAYRAELITRTEVARAQTLGREARMQSYAAEFPDLFQGEDRFQYKFITVQRGPYPCKICAPLDGTVWDIDDPERPNPPTSTHANCRCILSVVRKGLNSTTNTPKPTAKRQAAASLSECVCCH
ncbi:MAG: minor capsid protein [Candidatus Eremiobacteraeota bacterium]|nr:minor capsid protein [Candidatus Eremiobacteraeota bacterium]